MVMAAGNHHHIAHSIFRLIRQIVADAQLHDGGLGCCQPAKFIHTRAILMVTTRLGVGRLDRGPRALYDEVIAHECADFGQNRRMVQQFLDGRLTLIQVTKLAPFAGRVCRMGPAGCFQNRSHFSGRQGIRNYQIAKGIEHEPLTFGHGSRCSNWDHR